MSRYLDLNARIICNFFLKKKKKAVYFIGLLTLCVDRNDQNFRPSRPRSITKEKEKTKIDKMVVRVNTEETKIGK